MTRRHAPRSTAQLTFGGACAVVDTALFKQADQGRRQLVPSAVTVLGVLVVPYRAGHRQLAARYEALLTRSRGVRLFDVTRDQVRAAAQPSGGHRYPLPRFASPSPTGTMR